MKSLIQSEVGIIRSPDVFYRQCFDDPNKRKYFTGLSLVFFSMFVPTSVPVALLMSIGAVTGWAAQANCLVNLDITPGVYHFDFILWRTVWCFVLMLLFGTRWCPPNTDDSFENIRQLFSAPVRSAEKVKT